MDKSHTRKRSSIRVVSESIPTAWGRIPTIGIKELVELKKTQRLEDYPVISRLVLAWFDRPGLEATTEDYRWAVGNVFTLDTLRTLFEEHPAALEVVPEDSLNAFGRSVLAVRVVPEPVERAVSDWLQQRITICQQADRHYWRPIIGELRELHAQGKLMPEGERV